MLSRSLKVRLALLLAGVTIVSTAATFGISYALLGSTLRREASEELRSRLLEFWVIYTHEGAAVLSEATFRAAYPDGVNNLVRVADAEGSTLFVHVPDAWRNLDRQALARLGPRPGDEPALLRALAAGRTVEVAALELGDGRYVQIGRDARDIVASLARFRSSVLTAAAPLALLAFGAGLFFARRSLKPITALLQAMHSIVDTGRMSLRLPAPGTRDELDELVRIFNRMLERIEALVRGLRESLDNAAHDLRTPVTRLRNQAEAALEALGGRASAPDGAAAAAPAGASGPAGPDADPAAAARALEECLRQSEAVLAMVTALLDIAEAEHGALRLARGRVDLAAVAADMADLYRYAAEDKGLRLEADLPAHAPVEGDETRLRQVLANLLDNAIKYTPGGGIKVRLAVEGETVLLSVADTGIGIAAADLPRIWERLYRADRSRSAPGLGLGLSLVKAIIEAHGGSVAATSEVEGGSTFTLTLPVSNEHPPNDYAGVIRR
jgi:signal transduction histidine kinase